MNYFKLFFILFFAVPAAAFAQAGPKFVIDGGESINAGSHQRGKEVHYEIKFKNEGDALLRIQNVSTSCGCSTALASADSLNPGETGTISFTFNGNGMGMVSKAVTVMTNEEGDKHSHYIQISMNMVDPVSINPQSIMTEGKVGDEVKQVATVTNNYDKEITISELTSNSPVVKVTSDKNTIGVGETASLNIAIKLYEESAVNAAVIIKTSEGEFQIPILVDVKAKQ
jgi:hypothetical protein